MDWLGIVGSIASILSLTVPMAEYYFGWLWVHLSRPYRSVSMTSRGRYKRRERSSRLRINLGIFEYEHAKRDLDERIVETKKTEKNTKDSKELKDEKGSRISGLLLERSRPALPDVNEENNPVFRSNRLEANLTENKIETRMEDRN